MNAIDLLKQTRRLEIKTRRLVNEIFSGQYSSVFRGLGMEFAEVREYTPGDDVRTIDWNVTARTGHPYVKRFMAEREMTVMLVVDGSASLRFGSAQKFKSELATEVAAVLAFSAIRNNDKVGLCLFTDHVEKYIRPQKGRAHTLRLVRDLLEFEPRSAQTNLKETLKYLNRVIKRKAVVFLLSDFYGMDAETEKLLAITRKRHDLVALSIRDPREETFPSGGLLELRDAESGERVYVDLSNAVSRQQVSKEFFKQDKSLQTLFQKQSIDHIALRTDKPFVQPLRTFFESRVKRQR